MKEVTNIHDRVRLDAINPWISMERLRESAEAAADEIARLTALEAKLRAEIQRQSDDRRRLRGELVEARGIIDGAFGAVSAAYDQAHAEWHHHDKRAAKCDKTVFDWRSAARAFLDKGEG